MQQLFPTTLFCDLPEMNWFAATNFHDQALSTHWFFYYNYMANTGPRGEMFVTMRLLQTLRKFYHTRKKVGLQYFILVMYVTQ